MATNGGVFLQCKGPTATYTHKVGEISYSMSQQALFTARMTPYAHRVTFTIRGQINADSPVAINAKLSQIAAAYKDGCDLNFFLPNGNKSALSLASSATVGGLRVIRPITIPEMKGASFATYLDWETTVEAEVKIDNPETALRSFRETLQRSGGGPKYGTLEPLTGQPIRQLLKQNTIFRAKQSGQAVGLYSWPTIPQPIWPAWLIESNPMREETPGMPIGNGGTYENFTRSWSYDFESPTQLIGAAHSWGT